jgi:hypothetical protein
MDEREMMAYATYPLMVLSLTVIAIPLLFVAWRVLNMGIANFVLLLPFLFGLGVILLIQEFDALGGGNFLTMLIYLLAGAYSR